MRSSASYLSAPLWKLRLLFGEIQVSSQGISPKVASCALSRCVWNERVGCCYLLCTEDVVTEWMWASSWNPSSVNNPSSVGTLLSWPRLMVVQKNPQILQNWSSGCVWTASFRGEWRAAVCSGVVLGLFWVEQAQWLAARCCCSSFPVSMTSTVFSLSMLCVPAKI